MFAGPVSWPVAVLAGAGCAIAAFASPGKEPPAAPAAGDAVLADTAVSAAALPLAIPVVVAAVPVVVLVPERVATFGGVQAQIKQV